MTHIEASTPSQQFGLKRRKAPAAALACAARREGDDPGTCRPHLRPRQYTADIRWYGCGSANWPSRASVRRSAPSRSNVARSIAVARDMADADVTIGAFPEQVVGGYPPEDLVQWPASSIGQRRSLERFAHETAELPTVFVLGLAVSARRADLQLPPRSCIAAASLGFVPKEKLPTYNVFYEGRTFSRGGPGLSLDADGVPLGDYRFAFDFGDVAVEVCEDAWSPDGPMRRRCYSGVGDRRQRVDLAVSHGRRFDAPRDAGDTRRRQPGAAALRQRGRRTGRLDLRRRRLHLPERPSRVRGAALRRRLVVGGRRSRSHAAAAHGEHHVALGLRSVPPAPARSFPGDQVDGADRRQIPASLPRSRWRQLLPAGEPAAARPIRAIARSTISSRRSRSA